MRPRSVEAPQQGGGPLTDPGRSQAVRRPAAILFGDVVGYARLMDRDEAGTVARLTDCRRELWRPLLAAHDGRLAGTAGDSLYVEFAAPDRAAACALALQEGMRGWNAELPDDLRLILRIGVHWGEVLAAGDDLLGADVNIAARLEALTEPGGVLISEALRARLPEDLGARFAPGGRRQLRHIAQPVLVHRWTGAPARPPSAARLARALGGMAAGAAAGLRAAAFRLARPRPDPAPAPASAWEETPIPAVIVPPFAAGGAEDGWLAQGMTEEITAQLSRQANIAVVSRTSAFADREGADPAVLRARHGVGYVVEGSVRRQGERLRVDAGLVDAESGRVVWSERHEEPVADIFEMQNRIAENVVFALMSAMARQEGYRARLRPPENLEAWQLVVRANHVLFERMNGATLAEAERLLRRAVEVDPDYAEAWALLAVALAGKVAGAYAEDPAAEDAEGLSLAGSALQMAPTDPMVIGAAAAAHVHLQHCEEGLRLIDRAIEMAPNHAPFHQTRAAALLQMNRPRRAIPMLERILERSPHDLQRHMNHFLLGCAYSAAGRLAEAEAQFRRSIELDPTWHQPWIFLGMLRGRQGRFAEAAEAVARARELEPGLSLARYDYVFGKIRSAPVSRMLRLLMRKIWHDADRIGAPA